VGALVSRGWSCGKGKVSRQGYCDITAPWRAGCLDLKVSQLVTLPNTNAPCEVEDASCSYNGSAIYLPAAIV
jgi:hypothetical protein